MYTVPPRSMTEFRRPVIQVLFLHVFSNPIVHTNLSNYTKCQKVIESGTMSGPRNFETVTLPSNAYNVPVAALSEEIYSLTDRQAVVIDAVANISLPNCIEVLSKIVGRLNILMAGYRPDRTIGVYLQTEALAHQLVTSQHFLHVRSRNLVLRPMNGIVTSIILLYVHPKVPQSLILEKLSEMNIKYFNDDIQCVSIADTPRFSHIRSFSRRVYVLSEDINKLPDTIEINIRDKLHKIQVSVERSF
nr:uncharacterized protein LOC117222347 isoform X2 [Megalopta genalis]